MSNEPVPKRLLTAEPGSDAERMREALQRMEAAAQAEPPALAELRAELSEIGQTIAAIRTAVETAGQRYTATGALLQDLERRMHRVTSLVGAAPQPAAGAPAPAISEEQAFAEEFQAGALQAQERQDAGLAAANSAQPEAAAPLPDEFDRVPTVSNVISQLGHGVAVADEPEQAAQQGGTTVKMLEAMVEELAASMPVAEAPQSAAETVAEAGPSTDAPDANVTNLEAIDAANAQAAAAAQSIHAAFIEAMEADDVQAVDSTAASDAALTEALPAEAPLQETPLEPASVEAPAVDEDVSVTEAPAAQAPEEVALIEAQAKTSPAEIAFAETPPAETPLQETSLQETSLQATPPVEAQSAEPVLEIVAEVSDPQPALETQAGALPVEAQTAEPETAQSPAQAPKPEPAAEAPPPRSAIMPEIELLTNFARMEQVPYMPAEIGTAVIFGAAKAPVLGSPSAALHAAAFAAEAARQPSIAEPPVLELPPALELPTEPQPEAILVMPPSDGAPEEARPATEPQPSQQQPSVIEAPAAEDSSVSDLDLDALLFGPQPAAEPDSDPAAFLLEPAAASVERAPDAPPQPAVSDAPASASPALPANAPPDPLAPLKAMSEEEKIAIFE